jgi:hypothetical protein
MKRNLWRVTVALVISITCFVGTKLWYKSTRSGEKLKVRSKVAVLREARNEVQRKSLTDFIWEGLNGNDDLYAGEQIRTLANSEAEIILESSKATIRLEPNSLVVLEENEKGLSLDFLEGNLFVKGGDDGENGVKLKSCGDNNGDCSEINLKSADLSLSRKGDNLSLEVFKGQAELQRDGKKIAVDKDKAAVLSKDGVNLLQDRLQLLSPSAGETIFLNFTRPEQMALTWKPLPSGYRVFVEMGASRGAITRLADLSAAGETGKLALRQKPGKWFVRLVARPDDAGKPELSSMVIPFSIHPKAPPALIEPAMNAQLNPSESDQEIPFAWLNRNTFQHQVIEISKNARLKTPVTNENLGAETSNFKIKLDAGTYYWRVTGYLKVGDKTEPVSSPVHRFVIHAQHELKPADLITPQKNQHLAFADADRNGVTFKWQPASGPERFKLKVSLHTESGIKPVSEKEIETPILKLSNLAPGSYAWNVTTIDERSGKSKVSETWEFFIDDLPKLEWADKGEKYEYTTPTPTLATRWKAAPVSTTNQQYRYRVAEEGTALETINWKTTGQEGFEVPVPKDGTYQAVVEALDSKGKTVAASDVKMFKVTHAPLLPAPRWLTNTPEMIRSDAKGNVSFGWEPVDGARNYLMILETDDGKVIEEKEIQRSSASLSQMKPGRYQVRLRSVDSHKRAGPDSERRKLAVPSTSDIQAPKIKTMKVK